MNTLLIKIIIGVVLVVGPIAGLKLYINSVKESANKEAVLRLQISEAEEVREALQVALVEQQEVNAGLVAGQQAAEEETKRYLEIFKKHDLTKLARAKPGLIELRVNSGTAEVFSSIERITKDD